MVPGPPDPALEVRAARAGEADRIAAAVADLPLLARYGAPRDALTRQLGEAIERGDGLIAAIAGDGRIAGMAWYLPTGQFGALGGYLRLIAVAPGHFRRGIGGALLDEVERRVSAQARRLFLLVSHDNPGARRFYGARGYAEGGLLPSLVQPGIDEVLMWKRLRA